MLSKHKDNLRILQRTYNFLHRKSDNNKDGRASKEVKEGQKETVG